MPARKVVSDRQMEILLAYLESNRDLANSSATCKTPWAKKEMARHWEKLASSLNCVGPGATKTSSKWREYWSDRKYTIRKKACKRGRQSQATGGGSLDPKILGLTVLEERILAITDGDVALCGEESLFHPLPSPLHNNEMDPLLSPPPSTPPARAPSPPASAPLPPAGAPSPSANPDVASQAPTWPQQPLGETVRCQVTAAPDWMFYHEDKPPRLATDKRTSRALQSLAAAQSQLAVAQSQMAAAQSQMAAAQSQMATAQTQMMDELRHIRETLDAMRR